MGAGTGGFALDYFAIASKGNGTDFGDLSIRSGVGGAGSSTRGLFAGGYSPALPTDKVEKIEIATLGDGIDFGDLFTGRYYVCGLSSPTRALFAGGFVPGTIASNVIDFVNISSGGQAIKFGDMTQRAAAPGTVTNSVRGIFSGGATTPNAPSSTTVIRVTQMSHITLASEGTATYFGELTIAAGQRNNGASTQVRGVFGGGMGTPAQLNAMEYVTIASLGDAVDFGDFSPKQ